MDDNPDTNTPCVEKGENPIKKCGTNMFTTSIYVPSCLYHIFIGREAKAIKQIQNDTGALVKLTKTPTCIDIYIKGFLHDDVALARANMEQLITHVRAKELTHFICIPVVHSNVYERFEKFKDEILAGPAVLGLEESLFQIPQKLHLTIGVLALLDNDELVRATQLLNECLESIIQPVMDQFGTLDFQITGIDHMTDNPSKVHVLFGVVKSEALQLVADRIMGRFVEHGLMRRERDHVKLHVTLINSSFRKEPDDSKDPEKSTVTKRWHKYKKRFPFDGQDILTKYATYDFGQQPVTEVHLSKLKTEKNEDGFYGASAIVKF